MVQSVPTAPTLALDDTVVLFMNQIAVTPVVVLRHSRSLLPSPLKSPVIVTAQEVGTTPKPAEEAICAPFRNQIAVFPLLSRQRISPLPLPSKSPVPTTDHVVGTLAMSAED